MKLVCMTQVYNENTHPGWDGKTNIQRFMESVTKYCDGLVVFDDGSTDGSRDVVTSMANGLELELPSNKVNTPHAEGYHRARSLEHCKRLGADWVLCLDPDEVIEAHGELGAIRYLCQGTEADAIEFRRADLWRTDRFLRLDGDYSGSAGPRLFRLKEEMSYDISAGYRSPVYPEGLPEPIYSSMKIIHYGYSTDPMILGKWQRFKALGVDLRDHISDDNLRLCDVSPKVFKKEFCGPGISAYETKISELLP